MKRITDPAFRYTPALETDIRKTFNRVREERDRQRALDKAGIPTIPRKEASKA